MNEWLRNDNYTNEQATVVKKEGKVTAVSSRRIKMHNVCKNMGVYYLLNKYALIIME